MGSGGPCCFAGEADSLRGDPAGLRRELRPKPFRFQNHSEPPRHVRRARPVELPPEPDQGGAETAKRRSLWVGELARRGRRGRKDPREAVPWAGALDARAAQCAPRLQHPEAVRFGGEGAQQHRLRDGEALVPEELGQLWQRDGGHAQAAKDRGDTVGGRLHVDLLFRVRGCSLVPIRLGPHGGRSHGGIGRREPAACAGHPPPARSRHPFRSRAGPEPLTDSPSGGLV